MTVYQRYAPESICVTKYGLESEVRVDLGDDTLEPISVEGLKLCHSGSQGDGIDVKFSRFRVWDDTINGEWVEDIWQWAKVTTRQGKGDDVGEFATDVEKWQDKGHFYGLWVRENRENDTQSISGFLSDQVYNGQIKNDLDPEATSTGGILRIRMNRFANKFVTSRPGTIPNVLGGIGGFAGLVLSVLSLLMTLVLFFAHKCCPTEKDKEQAAKEKAAKEAKQDAARGVTTHNFNGPGANFNNNNNNSGMQSSFGSQHLPSARSPPPPVNRSPYSAYGSASPAPRASPWDSHAYVPSPHSPWTATDRFPSRPHSPSRHRARPVAAASDSGTDASSGSSNSTEVTSSYS